MGRRRRSRKRGPIPFSSTCLIPPSRRGRCGLAYNAGRFVTAAGVLAAGTLFATLGGDYPRVGMLCSLVYMLGMVAIWLAPDRPPEPRRSPGGALE